MTIDDALEQPASSAPNLVADLERACRLISWMANFVGNMAPGDYANCYADLNEHWLREEELRQQKILAPKP